MEVIMKHKITSYRQDELYTTPRKEYQDEASNDAEALTIIQERRRSGYTISTWLQNNDQPSQPKQGKGTR
jgi:hypothetical protein